LAARVRTRLDAAGDFSSRCAENRRRRVARASSWRRFDEITA
jgi:hypothetical protein